MSADSDGGVLPPHQSDGVQAASRHPQPVRLIEDRQTPQCTADWELSAFLNKTPGTAPAVTQLSSHTHTHTLTPQRPLSLVTPHVD